ncbi:hypothetical protein GV794_00035 [Nocardia cyriacigeorgica]|uniref:Uncharacterized protein n=1 Tax=Nocardia cyriacigeorgica TaxID=135487 RepID=A0ABX0CIN1_9NOCA|nr:hypothetical protein [Nocardia cyriacigeorgica]NEW38508.1 hypothetical protein [Nocardia cyriacigeorgica]NEW54060.1 hypothetical protein [Nocardia cyriacigeorgica]
MRANSCKSIDDPRPQHWLGDDRITTAVRRVLGQEAFASAFAAGYDDRDLFARQTS